MLCTPARCGGVHLLSWLVPHVLSLADQVVVFCFCIFVCIRFTEQLCVLLSVSSLPLLLSSPLSPDSYCAVTFASLLLCVLNYKTFSLSPAVSYCLSPFLSHTRTHSSLFGHSLLLSVSRPCAVRVHPFRWSQHRSTFVADLNLNGLLLLFRSVVDWRKS